MDETWECVIVGGGSAGLSAALVLGRARRRVLVVDAGEQSNLPAAGIGGLLASDGRPPADLYAAARAELAAYSSVELRSGETVDAASPEAGGFALELGDGSSLQARKLLLAPGMEYRPPELPGLADLWGGSVFHCPFCHGWEVRDRRLGVLWPGSAGAQKALLLRSWSAEVTLLVGEGEIGPEEREMLQAAEVPIDERPVRRLRGSGGELSAVVFADGSELELGGLLVASTLHQRSPLARQLGVAFSAPPAAERIEVDDATFATSVPGAFAAGDACVRMPSVANAIASGSTAAAVIVNELMNEAG